MEGGNKGLIPEMTDMPFPPAFETPESYNQLNTILEYYGLPNLELGEEVEKRIEKLERIYESPYLMLEKNELEEIREKVRIIKELQHLETQCDSWEVELANMKLGGRQKYMNRTVEELEKVLQELREEHSRYAEFEMKKELLGRIKSLEPNAIEALGYIKEEAFGAYAKQKVLDKLVGRTEDWAIVLAKVVESNECKVEELRRELEIDRVGLLRIIYNFSAKGILEYDRLEDTIRIKSNQ